MKSKTVGQVSKTESLLRHQSPSYSYDLTASGSRYIQGAGVVSSFVTRQCQNSFRRRSTKGKFRPGESWNLKRRLSHPLCRHRSHRPSIRSPKPTPSVANEFWSDHDSIEQQASWSLGDREDESHEKLERRRGQRCCLRYRFHGSRSYQKITNGVYTSCHRESSCLLFCY